ncbi:MAG TPA: long-chain fatty acid--CoA ligase [Gaiellaceae bacterium]|nr:long-chain fatty acid--CoA ligase [Gaiellaceae bacterium]
MTTASPSAPASDSPLAPRTARALWQHALAQGRTTPAYLEESAGGWREVSWQEAGARVDGLSRALLAHGVRKGDSVAVLSRTRLEWILLDWAIMSIGAVVVGLYPTSSASECAYILGHSEAVLAFVEDEEQRAKLASVHGGLPALRELVSFSELDEFDGDGGEPEPVEEDDLATLIYTSGTTGPPKGCMLTHKNLTTAAARVRTHMDGVEDTVLLFLPMAHSFARICHQSAAYHGATLALCSDAARVAEALQRTRPTILPAVPRVYEKIHANALGEIERSGRAKRAVGRWALRVGARASALRREGRPLPLGLRLRLALADRLVFARIRDRLGGRLRLGVSGAAPLGVDVLEFFHSLGMLVFEGYGLTETSSSLSVNDRDDYRFGTVGHAVDGCEIRLDEDGEILVRSDTVFTGYYKDPEATAAAFTGDGWFRTGDVGALDEQGWLTITDRKKDLIITAGGKNIAPQNLENALKASRFVSQAVVIGDRRPYVTALIALDQAEVAASGREPEELAQEVVDGVNRDRTRVEQIKRFAIVPREFSLEEGELTPTLKLRRKVVHDHFAGLIDELYT